MKFQPILGYTPVVFNKCVDIVPFTPKYSKEQPLKLYIPIKKRKGGETQVACNPSNGNKMKKLNKWHARKVNHFFKYSSC